MHSSRANGSRSNRRSLLLTLQLYGVLTLVLLSPLPFGAVYQWSWAGLGLLVALLVGFSGVRTLRNRSEAARLVRGLWLPGILYLLVLAWVALQVTPLTPSAWHAAAWAEAAETLGTDFPGRVTLAPYASQSELLKLLTYGGVFWVAVDLTRQRSHARRALWGFAIAATLYALYGVIAKLTDFGQTLWFHEMPPERFVTSTYVNRNMYADFAGFGLLIIVGLGLDALLSHAPAVERSPSPWRSLIRLAPNKLLLLGVMALVSLTALTMTGARGAILATALATVTLVVLLRPRKGALARFSLLGPVTLLFGLWTAAFVLAGAHLAARLPSIFSGDAIGRIAGYKMTLAAIAEAPLTGFGAGSFKDVFFLHNAGEFWKTFNYPHNLYLGVAVELGLPAAAALLGAVVLIGVSCFRGIERRHRDQVFPALGVAVVTLVAIHGLVDSPLYLPANAVTFSFLLGLAYAQAWSSAERRPSPSAAATPCPAQQPPQEAAEGQSE